MNNEEKQFLSQRQVSGIPVNKGILRALLQCDMLLHILFMYIREAMLRYFWIKMAKIVSESAFSVIKSLKYCRILLFCVTFLCFSLFHSGFLLTFATVKHHSTVSYQGR